LVDFQSPHDYPDYMDCFSGVYRCPASYLARVYVKYDTEPQYDFFYVYDNDSGIFQNWSGNSSGFVWIAPSNVNAVKFRFLSDFSLNYWGVDVDKVNCYVSGTTTTSSSTTTIVSSTTSTSRGSTTTTKPLATTTTTSTTTSSTGPSSTSTTASSTTTTGLWPCKMPGDYPPCGTVTITEILNAITQWAQDQLTITDILNLIMAWAYGGYYFM
jgi:hypothetical protein